MFNILKSFFLSIVFACILLNANTACGADVKIVLSEDISAKVASIGGRAKSVRITGISRDGAIIVGQFRIDKPKPDYQFFRYLTGSNRFEILNPILEKFIKPDGNSIGDFISPLQISADGKVIASSYFLKKDFSNHVFVYSDSNGFKDLGDFGLGKVLMELNGISADGSVLVGAYAPLTSMNWQAFKYSESKGFTNLQGMGKEHAFAMGVSSDGSLIVGNFRNGAEADHAFKYSLAHGVVEIASIGSYATANCVSDNGSVIVGTYLGGFNFGEFNSYSRAFIFTSKDGVKKLGAMSLLGDSSVPLSISASGDYFNGVYVDYLGHTHTFKAMILE